MSSPPTLVQRDDEERTIVDSSRPEERGVFVPVETQMIQRSGSRPYPVNSSWRGLLSIGLLAASFVILVVTANQQRRRHARLLQTIEVLQRNDHRPPEAGGATVVGSMPTSSKSVVAAPRDLPNGRIASRAELELEAVGFLLANDFGSALERYRRLSGRFPDEPAFADIVTILRGKLGCSGPESVSGATCD